MRSIRLGLEFLELGLPQLYLVKFGDSRLTLPFLGGGEAVYWERPYFLPQKATPRWEILRANQGHFWRLTNGVLSAECFERVKRQTLDTCVNVEKLMLTEILEDRNAELPDAIKHNSRVLRRRKESSESQKNA